MRENRILKKEALETEYIPGDKERPEADQEIMSIVEKVHASGADPMVVAGDYVRKEIETMKIIHGYPAKDDEYFFWVDYPGNFTDLLDDYLKGLPYPNLKRAPKSTITMKSVQSRRSGGKQYKFQAKYEDDTTIVYSDISVENPQDAILNLSRRMKQIHSHL